MSEQPNALSIDVEDWFHPELVRRHVSREEQIPRLDESLAPLLALLAERDIRATFFMLGPIVAEHADLVRSLHRDGHEIACHGMTHKPLWELSRDDFRTELREWRSIVRAVDPTIEARGYRAPTFSIDERTSWALDVLAEEGFTYDSSIFPFKNHVYGVAGAPLGPYTPDPRNLTLDDPKGPIREFPLTVLSLGPLRLPVSGGFYLRALPYGVLVRALRRVAKTRPFVLYCHPWEFDPGTPRIKLGMMDSLITYTGIRSGLNKFTRLLDEFSYTRMDRVINANG